MAGTVGDYFVQTRVTGTTSNTARRRLAVPQARGPVRHVGAQNPRTRIIFAVKPRSTESVRGAPNTLDTGARQRQAAHRKRLFHT
jgi:hypothetical protein